MSESRREGFDLGAYLARIGFSGQPDPSARSLVALHLAHATRIPFENLDILLGRPIRLDLASLQAKLVAGRRGGYCYEQNTLFAAALEAVGFRVTKLAARVRYRTTRVLPRTHALLLVESEGTQWIADVGFGGGGLLEPMPLVANRPVTQSRWTYRLREEPGLWVLQAQRGVAWEDLYAFTLEAQHEADLEMANYFVSTHPDSRFVLTFTAQRSTPEARYMLRNYEFYVDTGAEMTVRTLADDDEVLAVLADPLGLPFPAGTRFRVPTTGGPPQRETPRW